MHRRNYIVLAASAALAAIAFMRGADSTEAQKVEGFDEIVFVHPHDFARSSVDFRGDSPGFMTAEWWSPGQMRNNIVVWNTAACPRKVPTVFSFVASTAATPPDISRGPVARLYVNDHYALTFDLGIPRNKSWKEGEYELRYASKLVEWPFGASHRQFELHGDSGIYQLSVPASDVQSGKPVQLKVEIVPFARWNNSWFMVKERRDTLASSEHGLAEQVAQLQQEVNRLGEMNQVLATKEYSDLVNDREFHHFLIYSNGYRHTHPPDLVPLKNGDTLIMFREAAEHIAPDGDVIMLRSRDGGKTWGERQVLAGIPDLDERSGCGVQLRDGTIVMNIYANALYRPDGTFDWAGQAGRDTTQPTGTRTGRRGLTRASYTIISKDNGRS